jgi:hypothetical protein
LGSLCWSHAAIRSRTRSTRSRPTATSPLGLGLRNTAAGGLTESDCVSRGRRAIRQRHCSAARGKSQDGHVVAYPLHAGGPGCLWEVAPGRGRKPTYGPEKIQAIVDATLRSKPNGMTQWSCRLMAARQGVSKSTINNIWQSHNVVFR